jgi:lysophospholipase L1-like esterase
MGCSPESGSFFPLGETTVTCTATDALQRMSVCSFPVTVKPAPRLSVTRFVAFGDSLTWGEDGRSSLRLLTPSDWAHQAIRFPSAQQYPTVFRRDLEIRYTLQKFKVDNAGCPGEYAGPPPAGTQDAAQRFSDVLKGLGDCDGLYPGGGPYDVVLLMEGTNDVGGQDALLFSPAIANLRKMVREAKNRGVKPYIATIPPKKMSGSRSFGWALVPTFNDLLKSMASSENVPVVDVYDALYPQIGDYIGDDGLHPTAAGYAKIADTFFAAIMETLEVPAAQTSIQPLSAHPVRAPVVRAR